MRRCIGSVTPPVPSPISPPIDVGLLEIGMRGVQHERLPSAQLVLQQALETHAPALGHPRGDVDPAAPLG